MTCCQRGILLDRDGVLIRNRPDYVKTVEEVEFLPGVAEAVARLWQANYSVCVVTNQSGIGKKIFSAETLHRVHRFMEQELHKAGEGQIFWYFCPHRDEDVCVCRKPQPGLLLQAIAEHSLLPCHTWMVGDALRDVEAGMYAFCHTALVRTGHGKEQRLQSEHVYPEKIFSDLFSCVEFILAKSFR
jgi:histidinol-phosphate phosphatase family protein